MAIFQVLAILLGFPPPSALEQNPGDKWHRIFIGPTLFLSPNEQCRSTTGKNKAMTSTSGLGHILSSSITRFLMEGALLSAISLLHCTKWVNWKYRNRKCRTANNTRWKTQDWKMRYQNCRGEKGTNLTFPENTVSKIMLIIVDSSTWTRTTPLSHIFNEWSK